MTRVVILQPQYFPWRGVFEQVRLADIFVHYDDVQYSKGGFTNRVQVKTNSGMVWMTVPVLQAGTKNINETEIDNKHRWAYKHLQMLKQVYARAPYAADMLSLAEPLIMGEYKTISDLNIAAIERISAYFGFRPKFLKSSEMDIGGKSTDRVVSICRALGADTYVTGLGARHYIDYEAFEASNISLQYMDYRKVPYSQMHGDFSPYVSILDLVANCGVSGAESMISGSVYWKDMLPKLEMLDEK